jgi:hypothetical protein
LSVTSAALLEVSFCASCQILIVPSVSAVASFAPSLDKAIAEMGDA